MLVPRFSSMLDIDNFSSSKILYLRGWRLEAAGARLLAVDAVAIRRRRVAHAVLGIIPP